MFIDRLNALIKEKGIKKNKLLSDLGLSKNSFINWEKRQNVPDGETLYQIAKYFTVSMEYLIGAEEEPHSNLSEDEKRLITAYREHDESTKKAIRKLLDIEELTNRAIDSDPKTELLTDVSKAFTKTTS